MSDADSTPPAPLPDPLGTTVRASAPTTGAVLGTIAGAALSAAIGVHDPVYAGALTALCSGILTAALHALSLVKS